MHEQSTSILIVIIFLNIITIPKLRDHYNNRFACYLNIYFSYIHFFNIFCSFKSFINISSSRHRTLSTKHTQRCRPKFGPSGLRRERRDSRSALVRSSLFCPSDFFFFEIRAVLSPQRHHDNFSLVVIWLNAHVYRHFILYSVWSIFILFFHSLRLCARCSGSD